MIRHSSLSHAHNDSEEGHHPHFLGTKEKKHVHTQDIARQNVSFCVPRCFACKNEMQFSEGEIIYGEKWYHMSCWKDIEAVIELVSQ